jgi:gamma-butyrobetaine dioxygenase
MEDYYKAYRAFADKVNDQIMAVKFRLNPGDCFVLDNTRVLHARTAYSDSGTRWLQGCYVDKDELLSKISTM